MSKHEADRAPYFLISYAHDSGRDDAHIQQFYQDLDHDVLMFAGLRGTSAGFCDVTLRLGEEWSPGLISKLSTAQVFIAILSPVYFASEACGKEWTIFTSRLAGSRPDSSLRSSIIPLLWVPITVPPIAQPYQYREAAFGEAYEKVKLRSLIREARHGDDYKSFVQRLAERVVEINRGPRVAEAAGRPGFDSVRSAFHPFPPPVRQRHDHGEPARKTTSAPVPRSSDARPILNTFPRNEES